MEGQYQLLVYMHFVLIIQPLIYLLLGRGFAGVIKVSNQPGRLPWLALT
jgi:hypothetical protein